MARAAVSDSGGHEGVCTICLGEKIKCSFEVGITDRPRLVVASGGEGAAGRQSRDVSGERGVRTFSDRALTAIAADDGGDHIFFTSSSARK